MSNICDSCTDEARERNRSYEDLKGIAQKKAADEKKTQAICIEETSGLFITDIETAIRERFRIKECISAVQ